MHSSARAERDDRLRVKAIVGSVKPDDPSRQRSGSRARSCLQRSSKQSQKSIDLERGFDVVGSGADRRPKSRRRRRFPASAARMMAARRYPVAWTRGATGLRQGTARSCQSALAVPAVKQRFAQAAAEGSAHTDMGAVVEPIRNQHEAVSRRDRASELVI
jgi:hypothetical protein